jgi:outer membrane murein-binding lipoprotein Lpp
MPCTAGATSRPMARYDGWIMGIWAWIAVTVLVGCAAVAVTYAVARTRFDKSSASARQKLADALAALEAERNSFKETAQAIEEKTRRAALEEFLGDIRIEERHHVRENRLLFVHRKSLVVEERIFFRNIPLSNWVEHEVAIEEGDDLDKLAKTLAVFDTVASVAAPISPKPFLLEKLGL